ncbi:MAG: hypothetical protein PSX80_13600, partial [bacterium]|nr:hypothetical protein [bacterium]
DAPVATNESDSRSAVTEVGPPPQPAPSPAAAAETIKPAPAEPSPSPELLTVPLKATPTPEVSPSPDVVSETTKQTPTPEVSPSPELIVEAAKPTPTPEVLPTPEVVVDAAKPTPTPEVSPIPEVVEDAAKPTPTPSEKAVSQVDAKKPGAPLFEPIIITIPKTKTIERPRESKSDGEVRADEETKNADEPANRGDIARPRIVEGKAVVGELLPCEISVSQESVSLINSGGSISMILAIEQGEDIKLVTGASSSPSDIEVRREPELASLSGRSIFVIRSISDKTGIYQVTFKAPCGKKDVIVRVR